MQRCDAGRTVGSRRIPCECRSTETNYGRIISAFTERDIPLMQILCKFYSQHSSHHIRSLGLLTVMREIVETVVPLFQALF